jgi:hypothetical protein
VLSSASALKINGRLGASMTSILTPEVQIVFRVLGDLLPASTMISPARSLPRIDDVVDRDLAFDLADTAPIDDLLLDVS